MTQARSRNCCRPRSRSTSRARSWRLRQALPPVPPGQPGRQAPFRAGDWAGAAAGARASASTSTTSGCRNACRCWKTSTTPDELTDERLARDQAALHRPAVRPQAAGTGRDLLQLGLLQDPAPHLLPQRLHLRAPGGLDRVHRDRRAAADLPRLLPGQRRPALRAEAHRHQLPARTARSPTSTATSAWSKRACRRCSAPHRLEPNHQIQVLSSLFFRNKGAYIVGRVINGSREYPFVVPDPAQPPRRAGARHGAVRPRADRRCCSRFTRAYFLVDMEVPSAYVQFLRTLLPRKPRSELYTMLGLQKQGKTLFYRDFLHHLKHSLRPLRDRARHPRPGDAGVRAAVLPLRVQGDQGLLSRRRRTPRARRSRKSTCWSSTTTASAAWPTRWNIRTSRSRARASPTSCSPS